MANSIVLTGAAVLALGGAAAGVALGRSAVGDINPVYFQEAAPPEDAVADMPSGPPAGQSAGQPVAAAWPIEPNVSGLSTCDHCTADFTDPVYGVLMPEARRPVHDPLAPAPEARRISNRELDRYMSFPVTQEEARIRREIESGALADARAQSDDPAERDQAAPPPSSDQPNGI